MMNKEQLSSLNIKTRPKKKSNKTKENFKLETATILFQNRTTRQHGNNSWTLWDL